MLQNVEALREVKRAEEEVRRMKEDAAREAGDILRNAEREATEVIENARTQADADHQAGIEQAQEAAKAERAKILKGGEAEADAIRKRAGGAEFDEAVSLIMKNFEARTSGQ